MLFRFFEGLVDPTAGPGRSASRLLGTPVPEAAPPHSLLGFYWHFLRQAKLLFLMLFATGGLVALLDAAVPVCIGRVVALASEHAPERVFHESWPTLLGMGVLFLVLRPAVLLLQNLVTQQGVNSNVTSMIRWQSHWHVIRQGLPFFQDDFAGRIATRVTQTGPALRESLVSSVNAVWYILVYGGTAIGLLSATDWRLALPILLWFACYATLLRFLVPRMRERSRAASAARSMLTGRIVDSYTNILTVKLFARARDEDAHAREGIDLLTAAFKRQMRQVTWNGLLLTALNALMLVGTAGMALWLWSRGEFGVGTVATAIPMAWQISNISGWVSFNVTSIFENIGVVQESLDTIAREPTAPDPPDAVPLRVTRGAIRFENVSFGYGTARGVLHDLDLRIAPGERVGLVGHSGAGKSTLVSLLLRFHAPEAGRILVDGQDIATVTQESLRAAIGVVTQDTSLLHRSIRDNIRYGRPEATDAEIERAARQAHAHEFIAGLADPRGRRAYDAEVGERGVKLSGGQRQRVAIARVLLKDAPILVLDEATSALDSEVEAAIQEQLAALMAGKTVIAIAHRLSTIASMDRLVVMDHGRIVETGTHAELLRRGGAYARLWRRQSGAFVEA